MSARGASGLLWVVAAAAVSVAGWALYHQDLGSSYEECVLKRMQGIGSDIAAKTVLHNCRSLFPLPPPPPPLTEQQHAELIKRTTPTPPTIEEIIARDPDLSRWIQDASAWKVVQEVDEEQSRRLIYLGRSFAERQSAVVAAAKARLASLGFDETGGRDEATLPRPAPNAESEAAFRGDSRAPLSSDQYAAAHSGIRMFGSFAIGWLVFYMMTKQKNPFKKPEELHKRPKWLLALGTGLMLGGISSSPVTGIAQEDLSGAFAIKAVLFVFSMIPVVIGFLLYKYRIGNAIKNATTNLDPQTRDSK